MANRQAILEALFTSRTRVNLLLTLLGAPGKAHYSRELERLTGEHQNAIWRELQHLEQIGLLTSAAEGRVKNYRVRSDFPLLQELRALLGVGTGAAGDPARVDRRPYRPEVIIGETD